MTRLLRHHFAALALAPGLAALAACNLAPPYRVPAPVPDNAPLPDGFKHGALWTPAMPADAVAKGAWWQLWNDPVLDGLEARVEVTNQNVAAARAAYAQARAVVSEQRAALFPTVSANGSGTRTGSFGGGAPANPAAITSVGRSTSYSVQIGASWEPDLFGRLANGVRQARASAQASAADLANATLAARSELAVDYLQMRGAEAQGRLLDDTIAAYTRALTIARNKYNAGTVSRADVETAQTQLSNARLQRTEQTRNRAVLEDAVAVLVGANPSTFALAPAPWAPTTPAVPGVLPSQLLQRRPDVAAAERAVAAANAGIGIQRAGFFPTLGLSGSVGSTAGAIGDLFTAASSFWSLGVSVAQTVFDFGATRARVRAARAQYDQAVAAYRQTVLTAFRQVEDNLAAIAAYRDESGDAATAAQAATRAETIANNQYLAGTVDYTSVTAARATALAARENLIQITVERQTAAVALIEAAGGEWAGPVALDPLIPSPTP